jgi:hypothetical protein
MIELTPVIDHLSQAPVAPSLALTAPRRRQATNQNGFNVEVLSPFGWRVVGFRKPYDSPEAAETAMEQLLAMDSNEREYRVYPALAARA